MDVLIEQSWKQELKEEFEKEYFKGLVGFLKQEKANGKVIYPPGKQIFNAFNFTPFGNVKVVIIGQDPYYNFGQAHGLCFSVLDGVKVPPSLVNIFAEINNDLNIPVPKSGNLEKWAKQGVLLLNAALTVEAEKPMSHSKAGWQFLTDSVIEHVSKNRDKVVFLLWGAFAQNKEALIDSNKHKILKAVHPSPLSAHRGFLGCKHFSQANNWLVENGLPTIDWDLAS